MRMDMKFILLTDCASSKPRPTWLLGSRASTPPRQGEASQELEQGGWG